MDKTTFNQAFVAVFLAVVAWSVNEVVTEVKEATASQKISTATMMNINAQMEGVKKNQEKQYKAQEKANDKIHKMEINNKVTNAQLDAYWKQANEINSKLADQGERMAVILRDLKNHTHHGR